MNEQAEKQAVEAAGKSSGFLGNLRLPASLLLGGLVAFSAYYVLYVQQKSSYLFNRNLRLLVGAADQVDSKLRDYERVLESFVQAGRMEEIGDYVDDLSRHSGGCKVESPCPATETKIGIWSRTETRTRGRWMLELPYWGYQGQEREEVSAGQVVLDVERVLRTVFDPLLEAGVFESVFVAERSGRVVYQVGANGLEIADVTALIDLAYSSLGEEDRPGPPSADLLQVTHIQKVPLAGTTYRLFSHPHSFPVPPAGVVPPTARTTGSKSTEVGPPGPPAPYVWVVGGLVSNRKFLSDALAISTTLLALSTVGLLLAVFSFPFLRLSLQGPLQRVRLIDVVLVLVCAVLSLALVTVALLDIYAYRNFKQLTDEQLSRLAGSIERDLHDEIRAASCFLGQVEELYRQRGKELSIEEVERSYRGSGAVAHPYPIYRSVALVSASGQQMWKVAATGHPPTPLIPVADRAYFREVRSGRLWKLGGPTDSCPDRPDLPYYLEAIRSRTTGRLEAMLARRFESADRPEVAVSSLTLPLWSLIDTSLVGGFGFAVIDTDGQVIVHSEWQKSLHEDFFEEIDQDKTIRSAIAARRSDWTNMRYSGRDHRAFVTPLEGLPWAIVTFCDKQLLRTVNLEWLFGSILLIVFYVALMVLVWGVLLLCTPSSRKDWLWPDPRRTREYLWVALILLLMIAAFGLAIHSLSNGPLLAVSVLIPPAALLAYYLKMNSRQDAGALWWMALLGSLLMLIAGGLLLAKGPHELVAGAPREAVLAAALWALALLLAGVLGVSSLSRGARRPTTSLTKSYGLVSYLLAIVVAVLPAIAFFKTAHRIQVESYVKYGQLEIARMWRQHGTRAAYLLGQSGLSGPIAAGWPVLFGSYHDYFHETRRCSPTPRSSSALPVLNCRDEIRERETVRPLSEGTRARDPLPRFLEGILPHHSRYSVRMRKLLHDRSSDGSRVWALGARHLELSVSEDSGTIWRSEVRRLLPSRADLQVPLRLPLFLLIFGLFLTAVYWPVSFICKKIFLYDLQEPLWSRRQGALPERSGENFYVVRRKRSAARGLFDRRKSFQLEPAQLAEMVGEKGERAVKLSRLLADAEKPILWETAEGHLPSEKARVRTLEFLETAIADYRRTVIVVSSANPSLLAANLGAGHEEHQNCWARLLGRFTLVDADRLREQRRQQPTRAGRKKPRQPWPNTWANRLSPAFWLERGSLTQARRIFKEESGVDPYLSTILVDLNSHLRKDRKVKLEANQLLDEIEERASSYYNTLWRDSSPEEKVILVHLAEEGLVGTENRREVRSLLARGLIRRDPRLRLMNETFRRFVMSPAREVETKDLEKRATEVSPWERFKWPFAAILFVVIAFFLTTQRELFNATVGVITGMAAGLPALVRLIGAVGGRLGMGAAK